MGGLSLSRWCLVQFLLLVAFGVGAGIRLVAYGTSTTVTAATPMPRFLLALPAFRWLLIASPGDLSLKVSALFCSGGMGCC